ncbi:MAG: hypothetical protein CM15mP106_5270 [Candidatus Neomarinimicrobiota bacterium]|nr:MAG: hypothetical protein CM15mP106_5270 [Candidatus Neomarinimicrobiota bacterium]
MVYWWMKYYEKDIQFFVLLENSGSGGAVAANCKNIFDKIIHFSKKEKSLININKLEKGPFKLLWSVAFLLFIGLVILKSIQNISQGLSIHPFLKS